MLRRASASPRASHRGDTAARHNTPPLTRNSDIPIRSSTRAIAASIEARSRPHAPLSTSILRWWRGRASTAGSASGIVARNRREGLQCATERDRATERGRAIRFAQQPARRFFGERTRRALVDDAPADSRSRPYLTPDGHVVSQLRHVRQRSRCRRVRGDVAALERLLDQVDAAARHVEIVAQQLIRRARRGAESAVYARAQDRVRLPSLGRVADEVGERGLQGSEIRVETAAIDIPPDPKSP